MNLLFFILLLHGIIHLAGLAKAFQPQRFPDIRLQISKTTGMVWGLAGGLWILCAFLDLSSVSYSWIIGVPALLLSQILIFRSWKDARFGTLPNLLIAGWLATAIGYQVQKHEFLHRVETDFQSNNSMPNHLLTEQDLAPLPAIVQKYLHYTRSVGKPVITNFRATFRGDMRSKPEEKMMQFQSVQYNFYQNPSRYFFIRAKMFGLPLTGLHFYRNAVSTFQIKLLNLFNLVDARGEKMNQAETVTLFNDMCLIAPATLIQPNIRWKTIDSTTVLASFTNQQLTITATLYFNPEGALINFVSNDRYHTDGKVYENYPWSTPVQDYRTLNGYFLPSRAKLIYRKPSGDFVYGEMEYETLKYNLTHPEAE